MAKSSSACCSNDNNIMGLRRGPWTPEEDHKLLAYIEAHGFGNWRTLPEKAGLQRCGKSCRLRWINYLRPDVKRGKFSLQEEQTIIQLHAFLGNRWSAIAAHLPKRTDNEIKNYWNTHIKKRFTKMGIDPTTHKPISDLLSSAASGGSNTGTLSHMAQWERARLEAEARLVKESKKLVSNKPSPQMKRNKALAAAPPCRSECLDVLKAWQSVVTGMFGINTYNNLEPQQPPPTTMFLGNPIDLTAVACGNMGGTGEFMSDDKPNQNLPELNERFDNSMCLHDTTYQYWTASAAGNNMVEDFWDISVHDFDYPMEEGNLH